MFKKIFISIILSISFITQASNIDNLEKKARSGDIESQFRLGFLYENGSNDVFINLQDAEYWYLQSKNNKSYSRLAVMAYNNENYELAKKYLEKPLKDKFPYALLYYGKILNIEKKNGSKYIKFAADKGVPEALYDYGIYMSTDAPKTNNYISYVYLTMASVKGVQNADVELNILKTKLSPKQIKSANTRAKKILVEMKKNK